MLTSVSCRLIIAWNVAMHVSELSREQPKPQKMSRSEPQYQRQRKARGEHHVVAELLQVALDTHQQQQDKEALAHAQRPRRKRAPRRRTRAEKAEGYADAGTQEVTLPELQVNTPLTVHPEPQQASAAAQPLRRKKRVSKCKRAVLREREQKREQAAVCTKFVVRNLVTREDPDERHDLAADTRGTFVKFGALVDLTICGSSDGDTDCLDGDLAAGDVIVEYEDRESAVLAFAAHDERVFGGRTVACRWLSARDQDSGGVNATLVRVDHMLTVDELEDDDEFNDVRDDVLELFERYGAVQTLEICRETGAITVAFRDAESARQVVATMHQSVYGGRSVTANLVAVDAVVAQTNDEDELIAGKAPARDKAVHVAVRTARCVGRTGPSRPLY